MAYEYAIVHLKYTIPLAGILTIILKPLLSRRDLYKTAAIIAVAFLATLPWDSYLIANGIWTYPPSAILGPRLFGIPAEELFFFVIQTYITTLLYTLLNKPVLHAQFLTNHEEAPRRARLARSAGQLLLCLAIFAAVVLLARGEHRGTYLGLILIWACPFILLTWTFSGYFVLALPRHGVALPIILPTLYLWVVDELALRRGTWAITSGTKLGWRLWGSLEVEEAIFFLVTNTLIVFGLVAMDRGLAVLDTFHDDDPSSPSPPSSSPALSLVRAMFADPAGYDMERVRGIREAVATLRRKSRSFYLASAVFPGRLRLDMVILYAFCRVADDLVDDSRTAAESLGWIEKLTTYLDLKYGGGSGSTTITEKQNTDVNSYISQNFPLPTQSALTLLPTDRLPHEPFYELLEGFRTDVSFTLPKPEFPISSEADLQMYGRRVASTVGSLCLQLVFHHDFASSQISPADQARLADAALTMGWALQYVNIARDIQVDATPAGGRRVYLPKPWLAAHGLKPEDILSDPRRPEAEILRQRLLNLAFREYSRARPTMDLLPRHIRGPLVVAVESYMEIGRVLREGSGVPSPTKGGRATVPRGRRLWVAWKNLWVA